MKKSGFVLAVLASSISTAWAQSSNVTIYGIVDGGVQHVTGTRGGDRTNAVSGIMDGTRFGVRGTEDLGGGYKAIFTLENRTELDTGGQSNRPVTGNQLPDRMTNATLLGLPTILQPTLTNVVAPTLANQAYGVNLDNKFWDRQAYVGMITPVGAVLAGRQYTPSYEINAAYDIMGTQSSLSAGQVASFPPAVDIRLSNTVQYRIQTEGITASAMYGFGEGSTSSGRFWGGQLQYKNQNFSAGVGYNDRENELGQQSLQTLTVGASVNVGAGTASVMYGKVKDDNPSGLSGLAGQLGGTATAVLIQNAYIQAFKQDGDLYHVGYRHTFGPNTVYVAYSLFDDRRTANADTASYGVGYTYAFSKRTDVNFIATHFDNRGLGQALPGQGGFLGGVTDTAGTDANSIALGLRHRF